MNALVPAPLNAGGAVRAIVPQDFDGAWRIALAVTKAGMAPRGLETPEKAMVAIMHGLEVGFTPMAALQSIAVINSRATIWGDGALGLVQASGKMSSHKEWFEGEGDTRKAFCRVVRKGDPEAKLGEFSVTDAKQAGLWGKKGKNGEPTPWVTYSDRMLKMRARAFALRDGFADVLKGLGIAEEVQDTLLAEPQVVAPPPPPAQIAAPTTETITVTTNEGETVEAVAEVDPVDYGDYFERLQEAMNDAKDAASIEEVWNDFDPDATFQDDADSMVLATTIKQRQLAKVHPINAG
ncbi:hypothetical protein FJ973_29805 [Mesorhizobium sp. B2-1-3]|uniref:hypothetical protein n=1 Tax=Mesorhizobium sp. B2-1-3 TaxID=2589972 RepID=UPI00112601A7|nr:hypothetical protein [Mesorhizobium sp. B2-1-3]TPN03840.1 hypothetical protein FJ973_29805 [Mesorhizobium sp. B2-1-3]